MLQQVELGIWTFRTKSGQYARKQMRGYPNIQRDHRRSGSVGIPQSLLAILQRFQREIHMLEEHPAFFVQADRPALPQKQLGP
ncbi:hypothetical protein D3C73_1463070 [compost metagenome]